jgi:hypothetical protein
MWQQAVAELGGKLWKVALDKLRELLLTGVLIPVSQAAWNKYSERENKNKAHQVLKDLARLHSSETSFSK